MKRYNFLLICIIAIGCLITSCQKEEILKYNQPSGVSFTFKDRSYTFAENPGKSLDTLNISIEVSGNCKDYDRKFSAYVFTDSITTGNEINYEILEGTVKANEFSGKLPILIKKTDDLNDRVDTLRIKLKEGEDFPICELGQDYCDIYYTSKIIKPSNWRYLKGLFGTYSTRYWKFIMETVGNNVPYYPSHSDKKKWWMTPGDANTCKQLVKIRLHQYNIEHEGDELKHDDGELANEKIVIP